MRTLDPQMGKNPKTPKAAQAHLSESDYNLLHELANSKKWSVKKYIEDLIEKHLIENGKKLDAGRKKK